MKKTKFIALALVVAFALSGIAYAAWTDTTLFNVTAKTGDFQIVIRDLETKNSSEPKGVRAGVPGLFYYGSNAMVNGTNDYDGTTADPNLERVFGEDTENSFVTTAFSGGTEVNAIDDNTLTVCAQNLFPGVYAAFGCEIMNNGTVPAALKSVTLDFGDMTAEDKAEAKHLWVELQLMLADRDGKPVDQFVNPNPIACYLKDLPDAIETALAEFRFDPSYTIIAGAPDFNTVDEVTGEHGSDWGETQIHNKVRIGMNEDEYTWENDITEKNTYTFNLKYNWEQWNMPQPASVTSDGNF
ncbi:MAG: hypothetical protein ACERLG_13325 [Sedimentibacter sp.]